MSSPKFCMDCGAKLAEGAKFCASCGAKVAPPAEAAPAAEEKAPRDETPAADAPAASAPEAESDRPAAPSLDAAPAAPAKEPEDDDGDAFKDPVAALLASDDDDDADHLEMPEGESGKQGFKLSMGGIILIAFVVIVVGIIATIASSDELSARFQCNVLGKRSACITEEDRLFEIEQAEKKEEIELMTHHYGGFDLNFTPEKETSFTIRQHRYEEDRKEFVKRIREGATDSRVRKTTRVGAYSEKKGTDGVIKGNVAFADGAKEPTYAPTKGKDIVLPLSLPELPLLEREQVDGNGKRLSADDIAKIEKAKENPELDGEGKPVRKPELKVKTLAISTWVYEIELTAPGFKPRKIVFFEAPAPPDIDVKKLEEEGITVRPFKRRPDGRFIIDNASFDLLPEPRTLWTRYVQAQKEIYCLQQTAEYKGKSDQGKADAEALLWEQKAFTQEILDIAHQNDEDPEWIKYREEQFKGYVCPKL
ncbi:MAG: zinc ribbon domain-containing protein [Deltaproteobacteria bacterium]|nr:zinc ribbon domain-containing protein [Deltaproteobacteria bacterium]